MSLPRKHVQAFVPRLLRRCRVNAYVTGNLDTEAAAGLARHVQTLLSEQLKTQPPFGSQVRPQSLCHARLRRSLLERFRAASLAQHVQALLAKHLEMQDGILSLAIAHMCWRRRKMRANRGRRFRHF